MPTQQDELGRLRCGADATHLARKDASACKRGGLFARLLVSINHCSGCFPADRCRIGGYVRLIRPLYVVRLTAFLLGTAVCLPSGLEAQTRKTSSKAKAT